MLVVCTLALSWLLMQVVHESGHFCAALLTGGTVQRVVLVPWELSRTDILRNPLPLLVCWSGPLVGVLLPVCAWLIGRSSKWQIEFWLRFFAGFCLIANGAYLAAGSFTHEGDAGDLIRDGCPAWIIWLFGIVTVPTGLAAWHGLGKQFGIGRDATTIHWSASIVCACVLAVVIFAEVIYGAISR